jgi:hypothetical protein
VYCTQCGTANDDASKTCTACGAALVLPGVVSGQPAQKVPSYLLQSILVTLCCCQIPGIVAIVYAAQVNGALAMGNYERARRCSRLAFVWMWVAFGLGVCIGLGYGLLAVIGAGGRY